MLGVILCGGQSKRMGTDKGLLKLHANTWAQTAIDKVAALNIQAVISVNKDQLDAYSSIFPLQQLVADKEALKIKGPLGGLMSVHLQYPHEDLLVLACDMPLMEAGLLKELMIHYLNDAADAIVFTTDGEPEPLCGVYKAKGLAHIFGLYQTSQLPKHSMKYMLEHIVTYAIPAHEDKKKCFRNFNAHAELNGL